MGWTGAEFSVEYPSVSLEIRGLTKRDARNLAETIATSYLTDFPEEKLFVHIYDWDSLEELRLDMYELK